MGTPRPVLSKRRLADGSPLDYRAFVPAEGGAQSVVVLVHGASRSAAMQFRSFLPAAIASGTPLLAPTFSEAAFSGYQRLRGAAGALAAADALTEMLDDAGRELGLETHQVGMVGFSGGAQFAHRYAMVRPERVRALVLASAGWFTLLDSRLPFPEGTRASLDSRDRDVDIDAFLGVPLHLLVGERDVETGGRLRHSRSLDRRQGSHRLARALHWIDHVEDVAKARGRPSRVSFDLMADTGHSFTEAAGQGRLVERALAFLRAAQAATTATTTEHGRTS
jgi:pimeloyl-ACP methyl ester carboxylesterase